MIRRLLLLTMLAAPCFGQYAKLPFHVIGSVPSIPTLSSPADDATDVSVTPTVEWNAASGATTYDVEIALNVGFTVVVDSKVGTALTNYPLTVTLSVNTEHFWRVRANNSTGSSDWSTVWSFTTVANTVTHDATVASNVTQGELKVLSMTVGDNANKTLLVWVACYQPDTNVVSIIGATWSGEEALDSVAGVHYANDHNAVILYKLVAPSSGTADITITSAYTNTFMRVIGSSWYGVNQTTPLGTAVPNFSDDGTSDNPNATVSSAAGEVVIDGAVAEYTFVSHGAGQTQRALDESDGMWTCTTKNGAASVLMEHTVLDVLASWGIIAVPIKP